MQTQVVERCGILMQVQYEEPSGEPMTFHDVRVLDGNYKPCGPNLIPLLDPMLVLQEGGTGYADPVLSTFVIEVQK